MRRHNVPQQPFAFTLGRCLLSSGIVSSFRTALLLRRQPPFHRLPRPATTSCGLTCGARDHVNGARVHVLSFSSAAEARISGAPRIFRYISGLPAGEPGAMRNSHEPCQCCLHFAGALVAPGYRRTAWWFVCTNNRSETVTRAARECWVADVDLALVLGSIQSTKT